MKRYRIEDDAEFMQSLNAAILQSTPVRARNILRVIAALLVILLIWASIADVEEVTRGEGKVVPAQQLQIVQNLEGGIVSEILVREGERVTPSQVILKIDDTRFASSFKEHNSKLLTLRLKQARLRAEASGVLFKPEKALVVQAPNLVTEAMNLYKLRIREYKTQRSILKDQVQQRQQELMESQSQLDSSKRSLELVEKELGIMEPLSKQGVVAEVEILQLRRRLNDLNGEIDALSIGLPRMRSVLEESKSKLSELDARFRREAQTELNEVGGELAALEEAGLALQDRVQRTQVRAPVSGVVKRILVNTVGGVVQPGGPILEIVPYEDALLIEVNIKPADIANIAVGQTARLKFTAYDFAIHGSLDGEVEFLSADTVTNESGESFYVARIRPTKDFLGPKGKPLPIRVGMTAEADIITDKKTVLEYLLKPINRGLERALSEA